MNISNSISRRNLVVLLGAGASVEAGVPHVWGFVIQFEKWLRSHYGNYHPVTRCYKSIKQSWNALPEYKDTLHLENLFELLHFINGSMDSDPIPRLLPSAFPQRGRTTELLYWDLMRFVYGHCVNIESDRLRYLHPLAALAKKFPRLTIITLNYDTCVERVLNAQKVPWSDGFLEGAERYLPFFSPARNDPSYVKLLKLHGSVSWHKRGPRTIRLLGNSEELVARKLNLAQSMVDRSAMIFPVMNKGLAHGPFPALFAEAQQALSEAALCVAIGYGFNDQHIRRMVIDSMRVKRELRIAIVNPDPKPPMRLLYEEAGDLELQRRIGFIEPDPDSSNFLRNTFQRGKLSKTVDQLLYAEGSLHVADRFAPHTKSALQILSKGNPDQKPWELRFPLSKRASRMLLARRQLKVIAGDEIHSIDISTGEGRLVSKEFRNPVCMAYDVMSDSLYVAENQYRLQSPERVRLDLQNRFGLGRLWMKRGDEPAVPISALRIADQKLANIERGLVKDLDYLHKFKGSLTGVLRFPTELLIDVKKGGSLLIAQAGSGIWRFGLVGGDYKIFIKVPECMNLIAACRYSSQKALLIDGGVHPNGYGRLMDCDLESKRIEVLAGGWPQVSGVAFDKSRELILISQGYSWPKGRVFALDATCPQNPIVCEWRGLHHPCSIVVDELTSKVFTSSNDGVYELGF